MKRMFWLDLEMTGLDVESCAIIEVAAIVTDLELNSLDEYTRVVRQPQAVLDAMDAWCIKTHGESGLTAEVPTGTPLDQVETDLLALLDRHFGAEERVVLCGNSIHQDRRFIDRYMERLAARLHYRMVDVSSFKEVFRSRYGVQWEKANNHRALQDTRESIRELAEYLRHVQLPAPDRQKTS
jgi:oligoribonuclease